MILINNVEITFTKFYIISISYLNLSGVAIFFLGIHFIALSNPNSLCTPLNTYPYAPDPNSYINYIIYNK